MMKESLCLLISVKVALFKTESPISISLSLTGVPGSGFVSSVTPF